MPNLTQVGDDFLYYNKGLTQLEMPNLTQVGDDFLYYNKGLTQLEMPNLTQVGDSFLHYNEGLTQLELPNLPELKEKFSDIIDRNIEVIESQKSKNKGIITAQSIAQLDKDNELTTSEISIAHRIIEKIRGLLKKKDDHER